MNTWKSLLILCALLCVYVTGCGDHSSSQTAIDHARKEFEALKTDQNLRKLLDLEISSAMEDFEAKKFDDALVKLNEVDKLKPNDPFTLNLLGAAYTKKKEYMTARSFFERSLDQDPGFFPARFNLGEVMFLQKQYPQALEYFRRMYGDNPGNELLQFKVILSLLMTEQIEDAQRMAERMRIPGDSPASYYAQAAVAYKKGDKAKSLEFIRNAHELFRDKTALYDETFGDLAWPTK